MGGRSSGTPFANPSGFTCYGACQGSRSQDGPRGPRSSVPSRSPEAVDLRDLPAKVCLDIPLSLTSRLIRFASSYFVGIAPGRGKPLLERGLPSASRPLSHRHIAGHPRRGGPCPALLQAVPWNPSGARSGYRRRSCHYRLRRRPAPRRSRPFGSGALHGLSNRRQTIPRHTRRLRMPFRVLCSVAGGHRTRAQWCAIPSLASGTRGQKAMLDSCGWNLATCQLQLLSC